MSHYRLPAVAAVLAAVTALGCSVGTVSSQTFKAIARLRALAPELLEEVRS